MSDLELWLTLIGLGLATVATRAGFLLVSPRIGLPAGVERALRYAPACALAAIIAPGIFVAESGELDLSPGNGRLVGAVAAAVFYVWRRDMLLTIVVGMLAFTAMRLYA